jgi:hypothetical protein
MASPDLLKLWEDVRGDFDRARSLLPMQLAESEGSLARLAEWLYHNELGLALDELQALGEDNAATSEFWRALRSAAERMGLAEQAERLSRRAAGQA